MRKMARRNPWDVAVAWTGQRASYVSPVGNYGATGYSELAMHTGGAGKEVVRFALWRRPAKGWSGPKDAVSWAQVEYANGKVLDGLPSEVLPQKVRDIIGYGSPRLPNRKQKLQLWALSKGVAANPSRKVMKKVKRGRRVRKNVGSSHPIWKAGYAAHKFMSTLDGANLRAWRDVPLAAVAYGGTAAKRAYAASVATVQGRARDLASALQGIANLRYYKPLLKTPLRAVAGAFGLMEMLRSDF